MCGTLKTAYRTRKQDTISKRQQKQHQSHQTHKDFRLEFTDTKVKICLICLEVKRRLKKKSMDNCKYDQTDLEKNQRYHLETKKYN